MPVTIFEIATYLGATAWAPPIIGLGRRFFTQPLITVLPDNTSLQLGFGGIGMGPTFAIKLFVNTDKKDALVDFTGVEIRHTDGSTYNFEWSGMYEYSSEIRNDFGERQIVHRDTKPIAIKLSASSPVERLFSFRETRFIKSFTPIFNELNEYQTYLQNKDPDYYDQFLNSEKFDHYLKFMRESFWWKAGSYTVTFPIHSLSSTKLVPHSFQFYLKQDDIDSLKSNLDKIKAAYEFSIKHQKVENFTATPVIWNFRHPTLEHLKNKGNTA